MRGTTPTLTYTLPFDASLVAKAKIAVQHRGRVVLRKDTAHCTLEGNTVTARLTREDTVQLPDNEIVLVQLEVETTGGDSLVTQPVAVYTGQLLDEEALT